MLVPIAAIGAPLGSAGAGTEDERAVARHYTAAPPTTRDETDKQVARNSSGCLSCHRLSDQPTMHASAAVNLGCADCHGGDASVFLPSAVAHGDAEDSKVMDLAHVLPRFPKAWRYPSSANPPRSYTLLNRESPEFIRFVNPSDYRVVSAACGACHSEIIAASIRSLHSTGAMFWGGASYNNGVLPYKNYILGESYDHNGAATILRGPSIPENLAETARAADIVPQLWPLPAWESVKPADIFRVFERGGRNISNLFPETGLPDANGELERIEEPGRPDFRQSNRGPGTGARISIPVLNIAKTRLNDPLAWFMGTNDQPGDYRQSGCASCHVVYANDRDPRHSGPYARFGHDGMSQTVDPTIDKSTTAHPLQH